MWACSLMYLEHGCSYVWCHAFFMRTESSQVTSSQKHFLPGATWSRGQNKQWTHWACCPFGMHPKDWLGTTLLSVLFDNGLQASSRLDGDGDPSFLCCRPQHKALFLRGTPLCCWRPKWMAVEPRRVAALSPLSPLPASIPPICPFSCRSYTHTQFLHVGFICLH